MTASSGLARSLLAATGLAMGFFLWLLWGIGFIGDILDQVFPLVVGLVAASIPYIVVPFLVGILGGSWWAALFAPLSVWVPVFGFLALIGELESPEPSGIWLVVFVAMYGVFFMLLAGIGVAVRERLRDEELFY